VGQIVAQEDHTPVNSWRAPRIVLDRT